MLARIEKHEGELATCGVVWHELCYGAARLPVSRKRRAIAAYCAFEGLTVQDWSR